MSSSKNQSTNKYTEQIFISYARADSQQAEKLEKQLKTRGIKVWRDIRNLDPSQDFTGEIEDAIQNSSHVIVCLTRDVKRKDSFVRREIAYALSRGKSVIPLMFPEGELPIQIATWTYIDMQRRDGLARLMERLSSVVLPSQPPNRLEANPPELILYLNALHEWTSTRLQESVHTLISLAVSDTPEAVERDTQITSATFGFNFVVSKATSVDVDTGATLVKEQTTTFNTLSDGFKYHKERLLLLGEPGSGKTTALLAFAREAAVDRLNDGSKPIPILASIHRWKPELAVFDWAQKEQPVDNIDIFMNSHILYLLDGLDELRRVSSVNDDDPELDLRERFMEDVERADGNSIIISSRIKDYFDIGKKIKLPGAVSLQPLTEDQIQTYLITRQKQNLWTALQNDSALLHMARTPLLLALLVIAYGDDVTNSSILTQADIYDRYFHRRFVHEQAKPDRLSFRETQTRQLLGILATNMYKRSQISVAVKELADYLPQQIRRDDDETRGFFRVDLIGFVRFCRRMHFLQILSDDTVQFIHLGLRDYCAAPMLFQDFKHLEPYVRLSVMEMVSRIQHPDSLDGLAQALSDQILRIRIDAATILGNLRVVSVVPLLLDLLQHETSPYVRRAIIEALGKIGDSRAVTPLCNILYQRDRQTHDVNDHPETYHSKESQSIKILAEFDDEIWMDIFRHILEGAGYTEIFFTKHFTEAQKIAEEIQPTIAIIQGSDHWGNQGFVSGVEVMNMISKVSPLTGIIMFTAGGATKRSEAFLASAIEYMPGNAMDLPQVISKLIQSNTLTQEVLRALEQIGTVEALEIVSNWNLENT